MTKFLILVVDRVGHVDPGGEIPREVRRLQWSAFNVPLMWAAAANDQNCAILEWLNQQTESLPPVLVNGCEVAAQEALRVGWDVLCHTMRSWGVRSREDLAEWIHQQGFRRPRWGAHFSARAQERILNTTVARDARGAAIESVYIHMVLQACGRSTTSRDAPRVHNSSPRQSGKSVDNVGRRLFARGFQTKVRYSARLPSTFEGEVPARPHHSPRSSAHSSAAK